MGPCAHSPGAIRAAVLGAVKSCTWLGIWLLYIMLNSRDGLNAVCMPTVCCMPAALDAEACPMLGAHAKLSHLTLRGGSHDFYQ